MIDNKYKYSDLTAKVIGCAMKTLSIGFWFSGSNLASSLGFAIRIIK